MKTNYCEMTSVMLFSQSFSINAKDNENVFLWNSFFEPESHLYDDEAYDDEEIWWNK